MADAPIPHVVGREKIKPRAYAVVAAAFLSIMIGYSIRYSYGMLLPEMLPSLGMTKMQAGTIYTVQFIIYTIFSAVLGLVSDLYSYRLMLVVFTGLLGVGGIMMGGIQSFAQGCLALSIAGLGNAACWAPVTSLVQKWVPLDRRGGALSLVTAGSVIGLILWGYLLPIIVARADWRAGWKALGFTALAVAALNLWLVRDPDIPDRPANNFLRDRAAEHWVLLRPLFNSRIFWIIGIAYMLLGFITQVPLTFLSVYAREALHLPYLESTHFIITMALAGVIGQVFLGPLSDRIGRIKMMISCTAAMSIASLGMAFAGTALILNVMAVIFGLGYGAVWLLYAAAAYDFFPKGTIGSVMGLWTVFAGVGATISPTVCGWMIDLTGTYALAFIIGAAIGFISDLTLLAMPKRK